MNLRFFTTPFFLRFCGYALVLNGIWEFAQCSFLYDMNGWKRTTSIFSMVTAVLGDVAAAIVVIHVAALFVGRKSVAAPGQRILAATFLFGALTGIVLEWNARLLDLWGYTAHMPVLRIANVTVGLVPILQMALLPTLSLYFARGNLTQRSQ